MAVLASLRLAELLTGLSLAIDLGIGHPPGESMRVCLLATSLARRMGLAERDVADVYYTSLLQHIGCTAFRHEAAALFGSDEEAFVAAAVKADTNDPREVFSIFLPDLARGLPAVTRARTMALAVTRGGEIGRAVGRATCEVAAQMARRLQLPAAVERSLHELFERWDGRGAPQALAGQAVALPTRFTHVAAHATLFHRLGGVAAAIAVVRRRAGQALDPALAEGFKLHGPALFAEIEAVDVSRATVEAEPQPVQEALTLRFESVIRAFADFVDLKSPFTHGHSSGTAELAEGAAKRLRLDSAAVTVVRRGALLHDIGRVSVPTSVWERPGALTEGDWEQVRLHPYRGERVVARSPVLEPLAPAVGLHHERLDGSGYYRRTAATLPIDARVVAAADAFQAMTQSRPHRSAVTPDEAATRLAQEVGLGRFDPEVLAAVLAVAGHESRSAGPVWPAGLSDRQVEVLRLVAAGCSNRELAARLHISPRTAEHHVQDIYTKIGVSSRAAAAMFGMEHDLLRPIPGAAAT